MPIIVNKTEITDDEIHKEMQYHNAKDIDDARHKAASTLVIRQLLLQEAIKNKLLNTDETNTETENNAIDLLLQQQVNIPEASDENCQRYYDNNPQKFIDKTTNKPLPLSLVINHIKEYLHTSSLQIGIQHYIRNLANQAKIAGFNLLEKDEAIS